jgi:hypothetical protein
MNLNKRQQDWFYPAQKEAMKELEKEWPNVQCNYQMFNGENRIIESYTVSKEVDSKLEIKTFQVIYTNRATSISIMVYELQIQQAWHKNKEEVN